MSDSVIIFRGGGSNSESLALIHLHVHPVLRQVY